MTAISTLSLRRLAPLLATVMLGACAAPGDTTDHTTHHPGQPAVSPVQPGSATNPPAQSTDRPMVGQSGVGTTGEASPGQMKPESMEMAKMCAMNRNMQNMPPEQRQRMMDQHMKGMSPEMRQRHMEMMQQHCK